MGHYSKDYGRSHSLQRVSAVLGELSRELQYATENSDHPIYARGLKSNTPDKVIDYAPEVLIEAQRLAANRQRWVRAFGENRDLLHDPALDILLYLFISSRRHSEVSVSSACYAANVPQTTGLRYISKLSERGLLQRTDDPFDGRRQLLELTEAGEALICRCLIAR